MPGRGDAAIRSYLAVIFFAAVVVVTAFFINVPAWGQDPVTGASLVVLDASLAIVGFLFLLGAATPYVRRPSIAVHPFAASPPMPPEEPQGPEEESKEKARQKYLKLRRPW